ncbi:LITAF domain-containing protein-like isoform X1 [Nerophis lumbriciformis]|uniref:LITAF domain-containing protein-like isoform X1 n=1 Tax=Nerophis lumbriciformis TaxID=546530 RepID=UPI002AE01103|nr:LITAF domain-containing protein-like isoform X1 [Nerophis lumbriciformis]
MEKGHLGPESAPPYPGPYNNYGGAAPQPGLYPSPNAGPPHVAYQGGPTSTVTQVVVMPSLQDSPGRAQCPHCRQIVVTQTEHKAGLMTWAICGGLTLFGCFLCCCIPFCVDSCQDVEHHCPNCRKTVHVYKRC